MNNRKYPEKLLANEIAEQKVIDFKNEIKDIKQQIADLYEEISSREDKIEGICPHLNTKTEHGNVEGDYYNKGKYLTIVRCTLCGKEISKKETEGGYG